MQVSRSNSTHSVPDAVGLGRVVARIQRNELQIQLFPSQVVLRNATSPAILHKLKIKKSCCERLILELQASRFFHLHHLLQLEAAATR